MRLCVVPFYLTRRYGMHPTNGFKMNWNNVTTEEEFNKLESSRYYEIFKRLGPCDRVGCKHLLQKMSHEEATEYITKAEELEMWHPDSIRLHRKQLQCLSR